MNLPQSLQTIAEISIAFVGFSGLIVALRKTSGPLTGLEKFRLQTLLTLSFGAMFLSFLPEILQDIIPDSDRMWIIASSILCTYSVVFLAWWIRSSQRSARPFPEIFNWRAFARMTAGHIIIVLLQLASMFSLLTDKGAIVYLVALVWYLIHAAQQFTRMLFVQPNYRDGSESDQ